MDGHPLPHTVDAIGVAARESLDRGAVGGIDDENAANGRFAVVSHQDVCSHDLDRMLLGLVEMDAVGAVMLGARRRNVFFVDAWTTNSTMMANPRQISVKIGASQETGSASASVAPSPPFALAEPPQSSSASRATSVL